MDRTREAHPGPAGHPSREGIGKLALPREDQELFNVGYHEVLLGLLPGQRHGVAGCGKVRDLARPHHVPHERPHVRPERSEVEGRTEGPGWQVRAKSGKSQMAQDRLGRAWPLV